MIWIHLSELAVDRLVAGELAAGDEAAMRDHAADCPQCGALLDDALAVQRTFALDHMPLRFVTPLPSPRPFADRPPRRAAYGALGAAMAIAAGLAIAISWPRAHAETTVRTKGSAMVGFFVQHDGQIRRGAPHEVVMPGDRVELFTTALEPVWFAAISFDPRGVRTVYVAPQRIEAGREQILPTATELDNTIGTEVVTGVFCDAAFDVHAIDPDAPPRGCTVDHFALVKVPR